MRVQVLYGSKHGSTAEIADAIADEFRAAGLEATATDAEQLSGLPTSRALILGSAVYAGRWRKSVRWLVDAYGPELRSRAVWLFSSGPVGDGEHAPDGKPADLDDLMAMTGAREHVVFAGKIDHDTLSAGERLLVKALKAPEGDFRDWDEIRRWARSVAAELAMDRPAMDSSVA